MNAIKPIKIGDNRQPDGRFGSGNVANPDGRPKGSFSIVSEIKKKLQEAPEGEKLTYAELLVERILKSAIVDGNDQQIKNILNYVEGTPRPIRELPDDHGGFYITISEVSTDDQAGD